VTEVLAISQVLLATHLTISTSNTFHILPLTGDLTTCVCGLLDGGALPYCRSPNEEREVTRTFGAERVAVVYKE
jgi:hypothetical protein